TAEHGSMKKDPNSDLDVGLVDAVRASGEQQPVAGRTPVVPATERSGVDTWRLSFARYRALRARGWLVEAEQAVTRAHTENPDACPPLEGEVQLALDRRDLGRARRLAGELARCAPESEELAQVLRESGNPA